MISERERVIDIMGNSSRGECAPNCLSSSKTSERSRRRRRFHSRPSSFSSPSSSWSMIPWMKILAFFLYTIQTHVFINACISSAVLSTRHTNTFASMTPTSPFAVTSSSSSSSSRTQRKPTTDNRNRRRSIFVVHSQKVSTTLLFRQPRASAIAIVAGGGFCYAVYTAVLHQLVKKRFRSMLLLSEIAAVPSCNGNARTDNNNNDVSHRKKASERLPQIIRKLDILGNSDDVQRRMTTTIDEGFDPLWDGYLLYERLCHNRVLDGWYSTGAAGMSKTILYVCVQGEGRTATIYAPRDLKDDLSLPELLQRRKPLSIVEDPVERLAWRNVLHNALVSNVGVQHTTQHCSPGSYTFMYRDYVSLEEKSAMVSSRGGFSPISMTQDSVITLNDDGTCTLVDSGLLFGVLPAKTHNVGRWYNNDDDEGDARIEWEKSSVRIGWGPRLLGKSVEVKSVTETLCAAPWPLRELSVKKKNEEFDKDDSSSILLINRPSMGWLVFQRR